MEIVETTSMDEDYRELQSDLCLYPQQQPSRANKKEETEQLDAIDDKKVRYRELNMNKAAILKEKYHQTICVPIDFEEEPQQPNCEGECEIAKEETSLKEIVAVKDPTFKSFFFKNAIFRTAQSIIENHEKKNTKSKEGCETNSTTITTINNTTTPTTTSQQQPQQQQLKKRDFSLKSRLKSSNATVLTTSASAEITTLISPPLASEKQKGMSKSSSTSSLTMKVPGTACMIKESIQPQIKTERGQSGLLRFFESPVFNIHFAIHYLFYSKEPGVLTFIGNKIFSFPHSEVDNYIPQLILMYMQIDELAEVLDPYLVYRCRKSADFSLRCSWLLEAYNFNNMEHSVKFKHLSLMRELYPKSRENNRKNHHHQISPSAESPFKKTHHRSQSDATGRSVLHEPLKKSILLPTMKLCLGDLSSGRAFDNGCVCFESQRGAVNDLLGQQTVCSCGAPKLASEREFMKSLIDIGKTLTMLPTKIEKMSRLRVLLNLINKNLPARVWLPLNSDTPHHVVRITEDKTAVLNSKDRTPYIIYVEVVVVDDIYTSQVIPKMMPTLRHTKSDEHLDQLCDNPENNDSNKNSNNNSNSKCSNNTPTAVPVVGKRSYGMSRISSNLEVFNDDEVWSQEDDEITAQYLRMTQHKKFERDTVSQFSMESCDSTTRDLSNKFIYSFLN
jgi:phosphatidylinositol 4-kinase